MRLAHALIPIVLVFAVYTTYMPHTDYPYPINVDEWEHFAMAEEATMTGKTPTYWPIYKDHPDAGTMKWERNYHALLSILFLVLPFPHTFTMVLVPSIVSVVLALSSFLLMRFLTGSDLAGFAAAVLVVLMKSNITLMGPWFAVPSAMGLAMTPLIFYLFLKTVSGNKLAFVFTAAVFSSTALMSPHIIILLPVMAIYLLSRPRRIIRLWKEIAFAALLLFLLFIAFIPSFLVDPIGAINQFREFSSFSQERVEIKFNIVNYAGQIPFIFSIVGIFFSVRKPKEQHILVSSLFILLLVLIYVYNQYEIMLFTMYRRAFLFFIESLYLMAAFGLYSVFALLKSRSEHIPYVAFIILFFLAVYEPFDTVDLYSDLLKHYISDEDYSNLLWMRQNLPDDSVVLTTAEISTAIPPIAHKYVANYAFEPVQDLERLLQYPCSFEGLRLQYEITHVYKPNTICTGISLVGKNTYRYN